MSLQTLAKSRPAAYVIWALIFLGHIASIGLFTRGFLLTRQVLPDIAAAGDNTPEFDRAVILVVDALRYDFIVPAPSYNGENYLNKMPLLDIGGSAFQFIADPPTTTLQRLKGLTTGSLPTFIDAGSNFAGTRIDEDNWILQASRAGKPVAFVGDDTWEALYGHVLSTSIPYPSLDVRDLDTVDNGVKEHLPGLVANSSNTIVIGHMLGVDHVGHRYGPQHPAMARKMQETYEFIRSVAESIDDNTVLLVMGDHGMDQTGNHGGDSDLELWAGLWAYSKSRKFGSAPEPVKQIDFVPTISGLLGLPVPFNNLGFPIPQLLETCYDKVALATARQISRYAKTLGYQPEFEGDLNGDQSVAAAAAYQAQMEAMFRQSWATFNLTNIYKGIGLLVLSLFSIISLYQTLTPDNLIVKARRMSFGAAIGVTLSSVPILVSGQTNVIDIVLDLLAGLGAGSFLMTLRVPGLPRLTWQNILVNVVLFGHAACLFSNSYVINESRVVLFLLSTIITVMAARCVSIGPVEQYLGVPCAALVGVLVWASSSLRVCREENGPNCVSTFYEQEGTSTTGYWALTALSMLIIAFPLVLRRSYTIGENYTGIACLCIQGGVILAMMLITIYWSMDTAEVKGYAPEKLFETVKIVISRTVLGLSFGAGPYIWATSSPCVSIDMSKQKPKISGYQNIFGAYAYIPLVFFSWSVMISSKPPGVVAICALVVVLFNFSDLLDLTMSKNSLLAQTAFLLIGYLYFFCTGHQMTLVSIQWDSAFISAKKLSYPISAITVFLNTMGPFILAAMAAVLIALWRRAPARDARFVHSLVIRSTMGTLGVATFQTVVVMVAAAVLRRHLMTWKIFAPRFIYGAIILGVLDLGALIGLAIGDHSVKKVTESFGG